MNNDFTRRVQGDSMGERALAGTKHTMLDCKDAAIYLGVSKSFLAARRCYGTLREQTPGPIYHKLGRKVVYSVADLDAWLALNRYRGGAS